MSDAELSESEKALLEEWLDREAGEYRALRYREWARNLICWDGVLPLVVVGVPALIRVLFPKNDGAIAVTTVIVAIAAFFVRGFKADQYFRGGEQYAGQHLLFFVAIFCLVFVDALLIEMCQFGNLPLLGELLLFLGVYLIYLPIVGFSLFPLRLALNSRRRDMETAQNANS